MHDQVAQLRLPPAVEDETMTMMRDPVPVSPIVVEENDHSLTMLMVADGHEQSVASMRHGSHGFGHASPMEFLNCALPASAKAFLNGCRLAVRKRYAIAAIRPSTRK